MTLQIAAAAPLDLVAIQAGQVGTPSTEAAAQGNSRLDVEQRSIVVGEPVPIAFCRRRNGYGGILVSPGATEARFENDASNAVTASYLLVLSEGQLPGIQVRDVFQGPCRVGSHSQTYNRRAGTWEPGNYIVERVGYTKPEASYYCGSRGAYPGMTTVSFQSTIPNGLDLWKKQVHFYLRGGMQVTRLTDAQVGPSDNFCDLVKWMMQASGRFPAALIDNTQLAATAQFLENNDFTCNCWITESSNYLDYLAKWAPFFLLCESNNAGKRGLRPILPVTAGKLIDTGVVVPVYTFSEDHILPDTLEIQYSSLADRRPFVAQMIWRQQLEDDFGIIRTAEVRLAGTAPDGPYESHDLSEFCTRESHAVKVGAHILARRVYATHTIRFTARPQANTTAVTQGDIVKVRLSRQASTAGTSYHDFLYQVERITKTLAGELSYECTHFPVDSQGRSLIALAVANATASGTLLSSNKTGLGCDLNSATDTTVPAESFSDPDLPGMGGGTPSVIPVGGPEAPPGESPPNPVDPFPSAPPGLGPLTPQPSGSSPGVEYDQPSSICAGGQILLTTATIDPTSGGIVPGTSQQHSVSSFTIPPSLMSNNTQYTFSVQCPDGTPQQAEPIKNWYDPATNTPPPLWQYDAPNVCANVRWRFLVSSPSYGTSGPFVVEGGGPPYFKAGQAFGGEGSTPDYTWSIRRKDCAGNEIGVGIGGGSLNQMGGSVSVTIIGQDRRDTLNSPWLLWTVYL